MKCFFFFAFALAEVYFEEHFTSPSLDPAWVSSTSVENNGEFILTSSKYYADKKDSIGLKTTEDYHFYAISAKIDKPFNTKDKTLVIQYAIKHEQHIECGGGYIKLYSKGLIQKELTDVAVLYFFMLALPNYVWP